MIFDLIYFSCNWVIQPTPSDDTCTNILNKINIRYELSCNVSIAFKDIEVNYLIASNYRNFKCGNYQTDEFIVRHPSYHKTVFYAYSSNDSTFLLEKSELHDSSFCICCLATYPFVLYDLCMELNRQPV